MTADEFDRGIAVLIAGVGRPIGQEQIDVWREMVSDLTFDQFKRGIVAVLRDYKYAGFPPIGLIRQAAGAPGGLIDNDAAALLAWSTVVKAMREAGGYRSIRWDDPAIAVALEMIGESWARLCETPASDLHVWKKKAFIEAYKACRASGVMGKQSSAGIVAQNAGRMGFDQPEPVALGDAPTALYGFGGNSVPALPAPAAAAMLTFGEMPLADDESDEPATSEEFEARRQRGLKTLARMIERAEALTAESKSA